MRLFELINTQYRNTNVPTKHVRDEISPEDLTSKSGVFAKVIPDEDEHMVQKKYLAKLDDVDGYDLYIRTISDKNLSQSNPYFPRVYNVEYIKDSNRNIKPIYKIEKLKPLYDFDDEIITNMGRNLIKGFPADPLYAKGALPAAINEIAHRKEYNLCLDLKLAEALKIINRIIEDNPYTIQLDLSRNNFMMRSTPHGPQLVITDPLA